jgi:hypothetical protein
VENTRRLVLPLAAGSVVEITLANRANVFLLDTNNYDRYRRGESFRGIGGEALRSPLRLSVRRAHQR